jgi:hypothetical protein
MSPDTTRAVTDNQDALARERVARVAGEEHAERAQGPRPPPINGARPPRTPGTPRRPAAAAVDDAAWGTTAG